MQINECLYFYYESGDPSQKQTKFNYRILPLAVSWQLQPSLEVEANFIGETVEKNSILKHLEFSFKNVGKAGTEGYIGDILITQVFKLDGLIKSTNQVKDSYEFKLFQRY